MGEEVLGGIGREGEWESRAGLVGDIKRCQEQRRWRIRDKSTTRRRGETRRTLRLRTKSEVHTVVVERKRRCPRLRTSGSKHISSFTI